MGSTAKWSRCPSTTACRARWYASPASAGTRATGSRPWRALQDERQRPGLLRSRSQRARARVTASTSDPVLCRWKDSRTAPARIDALTFAARRRSRPVAVATVTIAESPLGRRSRARSAFARPVASALPGFCGIGSSGVPGERCQSLADYETGRASTRRPPLVGSSISRRSWCQAGAKGRHCTAYHSDIRVMRKCRQIARLGSLGPAEFGPSRDS